jgi:hypothetical protein
MNGIRVNTSLHFSAAIAVLALAPDVAIAGDEPPDIEIIDADIGGNGCPMGTARAVLSEDKRTLSIIFDEYLAEDSEYASCNIAVSLSVPEGITVALVDVDYRGYASVPDYPAGEPVSVRSTSLPGTPDRSANAPSIADTTAIS